MQFSPGCTDAFGERKWILCTTTVLHHLDFSHRVILQTDAVEQGFKVVISQDFEDGEYPLLYVTLKLLL